MSYSFGPWNQSANWSTEGLAELIDLLQRIWNLTHEYLDRPDDQPNDKVATS